MERRGLPPSRFRPQTGDMVQDPHPAAASGLSPTWGWAIVILSVLLAATAITLRRRVELDPELTRDSSPQASPTATPPATR